MVLLCLGFLIVRDCKRAMLPQEGSIGYGGKDIGSLVDRAVVVVGESLPLSTTAYVHIQ